MPAIAAIALAGTDTYFKDMAEEMELPYQTLINLYLRDCAAKGRRLSMTWRGSDGQTNEPQLFRADIASGVAAANSICCCKREVISLTSRRPR